MANEKIIYEISVTGNAAQEIDKAKKSYDDFKKNVEAPSKELPLARQLRDIKMEMQKLDQAGKGVGTKAFDELAKKAGNIKDSMNAANEAINVRAVGSNLEQNLNLMKSGFDTVVGSAQVATGTMALFGVENENVAESIQKMMALQSLSTGVMTVWKNLSKEGILVQTIMNTKMVAATAIQKFYTAAIGASTGAMKALKVAMISTGVLALVAVIGEVIGKIVEWKNNNDNLENSNISMANSINNVADAWKNAKEWADNYYSGTFSSLSKEQESIYENIKAKKGEAEADNYKRNILQENAAALQATINKAKKEEEKAKQTLTQLIAGQNYTGVNDANTQAIRNQRLLLSTIGLEIKQLQSEQRTAETAILNIGGKTNGNKKTSTLQNKETQKLINAAPDTFNVYINELGAIREVNIMSDDDEKSFQQKLIGLLTSAIRTLQVQNV